MPFTGLPISWFAVPPKYGSSLPTRYFGWIGEPGLPASAPPELAAILSRAEQEKRTTDQVRDIQRAVNRSTPNRWNDLGILWADVPERHPVAADPTLLELRSAPFAAECCMTRSAVLQGRPCNRFQAVDRILGRLWRNGECVNLLDAIDAGISRADALWVLTKLMYYRTDLRDQYTAWRKQVRSSRTLTVA
ncbi:hypothetical protein [Mesorhizobium wenxiniae]|uniref:hypothetical protein n=1 Tax=Mesorhizobium wenxiniae TaxID=2014805 RepID=UPI0010542E60|nr:hypothetical protein [Mesorhizobium wenxiniae]